MLTDEFVRYHLVERAVRQVLLVLLAPLFADVLHFLYFANRTIATEAFLVQLVEKALDLRVLPRAAQRDMGRIAVLLQQPMLHVICSEF